MAHISFTVIGRPQPKGAHSSFVPKRKDGSYATRWDGAPKVVTRDSNPHQEAAQSALAKAALAAREAAGEGKWLGPVETTISYVFERNASDFGTGRNAGVLKASAAAHPVTRPDIDKLERLVLDALTGVVILDDKQVIRCTHVKRWVHGDEPPHVEVEVRQLEDAVGEVVDDEQLELAA
jgi:Holliday junction resolvase RusA-like endonuclease